MTRRLKKGRNQSGENAEGTDAEDNAFAQLADGAANGADQMLGALLNETVAARREMARIRRTLRLLQPPPGEKPVPDPASLKEMTLERLRELRSRFAADASLAVHPEVDQVLEEVHDLTDEVLSVAVNPAAAAAAPTGARPDPAAQFKLTLPSFSGKPDELAAWKAALLDQFDIAGVTDQRRMVAVLADGMLLPPSMRQLAATAGTWSELWARMAKAVPFRQVRAAVANHLIALREITDPDDPVQVAEFCAGLATFNQQSVSRGRQSDNAALVAEWVIVELILRGMGPLRKNFFDWEDMKELDEETTDTLRIENYLQRQCSSLGTHHMIEARKEGRKAEDAGDQDGEVEESADQEDE